MLFRYDFDSKLDLSRFKKQATHYISCMPEVTYKLVVFDYSLVADIKKVKNEQNESKYLCTLQFFDLSRDADKDISDSKIIIPMNDPRFQKMQKFADIFITDKTTGEYFAESSDDIVNKLSDFIKMLNKLNNMKAFF